MAKLEIPEIIKEQINIVAKGLRELDALMTIGSLAAVEVVEQSKSEAPYWPDVFDVMRRCIPRIENAFEEVNYFYDHGHMSYPLARASWEWLLSISSVRVRVNMGYDDKAIETLRVMFMHECEEQGLTYMDVAKEAQIKVQDLMDWVAKKDGVDIVGISHRMAVWMENKITYL